MPWNEVMHKFGAGKLHSGSPSGPAVNNPKQAVAIMLSEKKKAEAGNAEYQPSASTKRLAAKRRTRS